MLSPGPAPGMTSILGEDLETIIKRKGKVQFTNNTMIKVPKEENPDDVEFAYKKD